MHRGSVIFFLAVIFLATVTGAFFVYPNNPVLPSFADWMPWRLGLDLVGGSHLVYKIDTSNIDSADLQDTLSGLRDVIERRVNLFGVSEPQVAVSNTSDGYYLNVDLAGVSDVREAINQIGETPFLQFMEVSSSAEATADEQGQLYYVPTGLNGQYVKAAQINFDPTTNRPEISLEFTSEGAQLFEQVTERNVGKVVAIFVDNEPISEPVVQGKITGGKAVVTGNFTLDEAREFVQRFNAGALPAPLTLENQQTIGASLGRDSLQKSIFAGIIGTVVIMLFMIAFYRFNGLLASVALLVYIVLSLAIFKLFITLSLAGIAGFLLSIGMAVDANVLIFERTKEELRKGAEKAVAIKEGFRRAWPSIRDSNISTIITTLILFNFTSSFVKGLALTLLLGVLVSMFTAITVTRNLMRLRVKNI
jgi:preprotein translocase subunit SecD